MDPLIVYFNRRVLLHQDYHRVQYEKQLKESLPKGKRLVGQSLCLELDLMRLDDFDGKTYQFVSKKPSKSLREIAKRQNTVLVYLKEYTILNALCYLVRKDSNLSLIVMFNDALHHNHILMTEIDEKLETPFPGCQKLRGIRPFLTAQFESGFESLFAIKVELIGKQPLGVQLEVGKVRADFYYKNILIELDGRSKLRGNFNRTPVQQFVHETFKSNLYQIEGYDIIRLFWEDLGNGNLEYVLSWAKIPKKRRNKRLRRLIAKDVA